jgi:hypothetical protein
MILGKNQAMKQILEKYDNRKKRENDNLQMRSVQTRDFESKFIIIFKRCKQLFTMGHL